jgi:hypothetical protein
MTEEAAGLVREIRRRTATVTSFIAEYRASLRFPLVHIEVVGNVSYLAPDRFRSETRIAGEQIVTIRQGRSVRRYIPKRHEVWEYTFADLPSTEPVNFGIADLTDPFFAVDEAGLAYEGTAELETGSTYLFSADEKNRARRGLLDTRKGFNIRYEPARPELRLKLNVDRETGLLRRMTGLERTGAELFQANYLMKEINVPVGVALFAMDASSAGFKVIDLAGTMLSSLNPDAAESPPSMN